MTTVSVVIPAYRAAATIDATLASVLGQIRPADEVIVVDDASDDDTFERVSAWSNRLPLTVLRNERNQRIGPTRARGIATATGDLIAPLDADDVWFPDHLSTLVPLAEDGCTIVAARRLRWLPGTAVADHDDLDLPPPEQYREEILRRNYLFAGSVFPRDALVALGRPSPSRTVDDWENWIRLIVEAGCRVVPSPTPTVLYRSSLTQATAGEGCLPDEIELCERLLTEPDYTPHHRVLQVTLRRRRSRQLLLDGLSHASDGRNMAARRSFLRSAFVDRSLRGGTRPIPFGSITLRASVGIVSPNLALSGRRRRLEQQAIVAPTAALTAALAPTTTSSSDPRSPRRTPDATHR
jgi:glycosyltransferase involved in cell wall biosynthesis